MNDKKRKNPTMITLVVRIAAAVYLLYLAWELRGAPAAYEGFQKILFMIIPIVFGVFAAVLGGVSLKALLKGEYDNGDDDEGDE